MKKLVMVEYFVFSLALVALLPIQTLAVPQSFNYQGYLTDGQGNPLNDMVELTLRLYTAPTGGAPLHTYILPNPVSVVDGVFSTFYDMTDVELPAGEEPIYLEVSVTIDSVVQVMEPRKELRSVPYALKAVTANHALAGGDLRIAGAATPGQTITNVAYAKVNADGTVQTATDGLTVENIGTGHYVIHLPPDAFDNPVITATTTAGDDFVYLVFASCGTLDTCTVKVGALYNEMIYYTDRSFNAIIMGQVP